MLSPEKDLEQIDMAVAGACMHRLHVLCPDCLVSLCPDCTAILIEFLFCHY